jgi:hypothetical protein
LSIVPNNCSVDSWKMLILEESLSVKKERGLQHKES